MPRHKEIDNPKRFNAVVNQHTYQRLVTMAGQGTINLGRPYSLTELVRSILEHAVSGADLLPSTPASKPSDAKETVSARGRQPWQGDNDE